MDSRKLDTVFTIALEKSPKTEKRVDTFLENFTPLLREYLHEAALLMQCQRKVVRKEDKQ